MACLANREPKTCRTKRKGWRQAPRQVRGTPARCAKFLAGFARVTHWNPAGGLWFAGCTGPGVIASSSQSPAASGASPMLAGGRYAVFATAKAAEAGGGAFLSFLDGCLTPDISREEPRGARQHTLSDEKSQNGAVPAPATLAPTAPAPMPLGWGWEPPAAPAPAPAQEGIEDDMEASGSRPASIPGWTVAAGALAANLARLQNDAPPVAGNIMQEAAQESPAGIGFKARPLPVETPIPTSPAPHPEASVEPACAAPRLAVEPAAASSSLEPLAELAFGARLLPVEPPAPADPAPGTFAGQAVETRPLNAETPVSTALNIAAGPAVPAPTVTSSGADPADDDGPPEDGPPLPKIAEIPRTSSNPSDALSGNGQSESQTEAIQGVVHSAPSAPSDENAQPRAAVSGIPVKGAAPSTERPAGGRAETPSTARADVESLWSPAGATPADREAHSQAPAQEPAAARSALVDPPEPAAQPVSRDVSLHLSDGGNSVDIRMAERAGEIRVTVHTPDHDLASSLRADLPDLVGKLRQTGYQAEVWRPAAAAQSEPGRRNPSDGSAAQQQAGGDRRDGRQRQPQQQQPKNQSGWAGAWESSLGPVKESSI